MVGFIAVLLLSKALLINDTTECPVGGRRRDSTTTSSLDVLGFDLRMIVSEFASPGMRM